jgi:hypothetical protein
VDRVHFRVHLRRQSTAVGFHNIDTVMFTKEHTINVIEAWAAQRRPSRRYAAGIAAAIRPSSSMV